MFVVLWQTGLLHASTHTMRGCHKMFHTLTAHPSVEWWRQNTRRVVQCGGSVLFCVAQKPQMPPAEQKKIYRLLNSGCHSFHRPAPSIIFWKMFHRHLTWVSLVRPRWCNASTRGTSCFHPGSWSDSSPVLPDRAGEKGWIVEVKKGEERGGRPLLHSLWVAVPVRSASGEQLSLQQNQLQRDRREETAYSETECM